MFESIFKRFNSCRSLFFFKKKKPKSLSHVKKALVFELCKKEGSILCVISRKGFNSLSHIEKRRVQFFESHRKEKSVQVFESYKKGSFLWKILLIKATILWVISEKSGSILEGHFFFKKAQVFESCSKRRFNSLSHVKRWFNSLNDVKKKVQFFEPCKKKVHFFES